MRHKRGSPHYSKKILTQKFDKIEVVNQLQEKYVLETVRNYTAEYDKIWIYDKIHHEINQYCSTHTLHEVFIEKFDEIDEELIFALKEDISLWARGINIISVRVTKPKIPDEIREKFIEIEQLNSTISSLEHQHNLNIATAEAKVTKLLKDSKQALELREIDLQQELEEKEAELERAIIKQEIYVKKEFGIIHNNYTRILDEIEYKIGLYTNGTGELERARSKARLHNSIIVAGDMIPKHLGDLKALLLEE